jgi:hypothetical protein
VQGNLVWHQPDQLAAHGRQSLPGNGRIQIFWDGFYAESDRQAASKTLEH